MNNGLDIRNLHVHYGPLCALHEVSLAIPPGRVAALVGRNGAGKSTLLKAVCGLVEPSSGNVNWNGQPIRKIRSQIAYLPQRESVDWNFPITVRGIVEMGRFPFIGWFRRFGERDRHMVDEALRKMQLNDIENRQISALSGGQQQRTFIARALAQEARIFLFDEPFTGLDHPSQEILAGTLREIADDDRLVLACHHDLKTVAAWFDEVILLDRHLVCQGSPDVCLVPTNLQKAFPG